MPDVIKIDSLLQFLNTGVITPSNVKRRTWESNVNYGFVSAGHSQRSAEAIQGLVDNDIVCAYISETGFVGIGKIVKSTVPVQDFTFEDKSLKNLPYINMHLINGLFANEGNVILQEYLVNVDWIKTVSQKDAYSVKGLGFHIHPGVRCELRKDNPRQIELIRFIEKKIDVDFRF